VRISDEQHEAISSWLWIPTTWTSKKLGRTFPGHSHNSFNQGCGAGAQAILDGWSRNQKHLDGGAGAWNLSSVCELCKQYNVFFLFFGPNCSGSGAKNLKMLEPEPKKLDAQSWSRSQKFEYRLHSPGFNRAVTLTTAWSFSRVVKIRIGDTRHFAAAVVLWKTLLRLVWMKWMIYFVADAWSIAQAQSNITRAQQSLVVAHYRVGVSIQSTLRGAKQNTSTAPQL